jgi:hypothetical protein
MIGFGEKKKAVPRIFLILSRPASISNTGKIAFPGSTVLVINAIPR